MITGAEMLAIAVTAVPTIIGGVVWLVRLEGRINLSDQKQMDLKELLVQRFDSSDKRLERIEKALNGALHRVIHDEQDY